MDSIETKIIKTGIVISLATELAGCTGANLPGMVETPTLEDSLKSDFEQGFKYYRTIITNGVFTEEAKESAAKFLSSLEQELINNGTLTDTISYTRENSRLIFYTNGEFPIPSHEQLEAMWDFLRDKAVKDSQGLFHLSPPTEGRLYVGEFADIRSFTDATRNFPDRGDSVINLNNNPYHPSEVFFTEWSNLLFGSSRSISFDSKLALDKFGVEFGQTARSILERLTYEQYIEQPIEVGKIKNYEGEYVSFQVSLGTGAENAFLSA